MDIDTPRVYEKIWVSDFFHSFQHLNFESNKVNSTFDPRNKNYQQSLAVLFLCPVAVCLLIWLFDLIYFLCRCCEKQTVPYRTTRKDQSKLPKVFAIVLLLLGLSLCGVGIYLNENVHHGISDIADDISSTNSTISSATADIVYLDSLADDIGVRLSDDLEAYVTAITDPALKEQLLQMVEKVRHDAGRSKDFMDPVDNIKDVQKTLSDSHSVVQEAEIYRWIVTLALLLIYALQFLLMMVGLVKGSKSLLIINATIGIALALIYWGFVGLYLSTSVASGDFCVDPNDFFARELATSNSDMEVDHLMDYMECKDPTLPYQLQILKAQTAVTAASSTIYKFSQAVKPLQIPGLNDTIKETEVDLQMALGNLSSILNNVGRCTVLHNFYIDAVTSLCVDTISSMALLLVVVTCLAMIFAVIILLASCVWRTYGRRSNTQYLSSDESDPFLPRPPPYESDYGAVARTASPRWSERGALQSQHSPPSQEEQIMILRQQQYQTREESPPPARRLMIVSFRPIQQAASRGSPFF